MTSIAERIAIIGMAGRFPEADTIEAFERNLRSGRDSVRAISPARIAATSLDPDLEYQTMGFLDRIDGFDHAYFGISRREAELMDPTHRLGLSLVAEAIERSGHSLSELRGSRTGVFVAASRPEYFRLLEKAEPLALLGNLGSALAGRIAYHFGLEGPALAIDTGCSSSLVALHHACHALRDGEVDLAIAGGVSLRVVVEPKSAQLEFGEIMSSGGKCRAFDARADGTSDGEGGAFVVLRRFADACAAHDRIEAIVLGSAVNQNGARSTALAAPNPAAQRDVVRAAWVGAGVVPSGTTYVEAHGSGTRLGDVIELRALADALDDLETEPARRVVGSVKTNIGHLGGAAGAAGLVKVVRSLATGVLFPTVHFEHPNPLIDFDRLGVEVLRQEESWPVDGTFRRAGLSSFGLTGSNVHVVLEAPPEDEARASAPEVPLVVKLSARTSGALRRYAAEVAAHLARSDEEFGDVVAVLNTGRDDHRHRVAFVARDAAELVARAEAVATGEREPEAVSRRAVAVVLPGLQATADVVDRQVAVVRGLWSHGVASDAVVGIGAGNVAAGLLDGTIERSQVVGELAARDPSAVVDVGALRGVVHEIVRRGPTVVVVVGEDDHLVQELERIAAEVVQLEVLVVPISDETGFPAIVADLYERGATVDWSKASPALRNRRPLLPVHPFDDQRCWCRELGDVVPFTRLWPGEEPTTRSSDAVRQRRAAREADIAPVPADSPTATRLATVWARALKASDLDPASDYFELGGNSVTALEVIDGVEAEFGVRVDLEVLYDHSTLGSLARYVDDELARPADERAARFLENLPIEPMARTGRLPMSFGQKRLWFLEQLTPGTGAFNIPIDLHLEGELNEDALEAALWALVRRHESLRSRFLDEDGVPYAVIGEDDMPNVRRIDVSGAVDPEAALLAEVLADAGATFDMAVGPLFRALLVRLASDRHVLLLTVHHSVDDGWSPAIFASEFSEQYRAYCEGRAPEVPALPIQYVDFAHWQTEWLGSELMARQLLYWTRQLEGFGPLDLPGDRPRPARQSLRGDLVRFAIPGDLTERLKRVAAESKSTLFMTILAGLKVLLHRYSGQDDVIVATPTAGRNRPETRNLIGFFNNTIALRTSLAGDPTFRELLARERRVVLDGLANQDLPYEKVVEAIQPKRDLSRETIFQVVYVHNRIPALTYELPGLRVGPSALGSYEGTLTAGLSPGTAKCDLTLIVRDVEGLNELPAAMEFSTDLFDPATVERLVEHLIVLLDGITTDPDRRISELPLLSATEAALLLDQPTGGEVRWSPARLDAAVAARAQGAPEAVAVRASGASATYGQLVGRAGAIAAALDRAGVRRNDRVGIHLDRGPDAIAAMLGAWSLGAAFVPLDPEYPAERLRFMVVDTEASAVVTSRTLLDGLEVDVATVVVDDLSSAVAPAISPPTELGAVAYVIYTSGSTGTPKGVAVSHLALSDQIEAMAEVVDVGEGDVFLAGTALSFDPSLIEIFLTLRNGGIVEVVPKDHRLDPRALGGLIERSGAVALQATPTSWRMLLHSGWSGAPHLHALVGGEVLTPALASELRSRTARVTNLYGPTEATVWSTTWDVDESERLVVPIGRPVSRKRVHVVDERRQLVPVGVPGELAIAGAGLADGYWGRPELTAERFVDDPWVTGGRMFLTGDRGRLLPSGELEFLGRADAQVKVRGVRIELGEIESVAEAVSGVHEAAAVVVGSDEDARITLHLTASPDVTTSDVRAALLARLPEQMVPSSIVVREALPRTSSGKVDRRALADSAPTAVTDTQSVPPRDPFELSLCLLWGELLGVPEVGVHDDFFELGGHSLLAVQLVARLEELTGVEIALATLFEGASVAAVAQLLRGEARASTGTVVPVRRGTGLPVFLVHPAGGNVLCYYELARELPPTVDVYGVRALGLDGFDEPLRTIPEMAARYLEDVHLIVKDGRIVLGGWSMGGLIAVEMARQLADAGAEPPLVILVDAAMSLPERPSYRDDADQLAHLLRNTFQVSVPPEAFAASSAEERLRRVLDVAEAADAVPAGVDLRDVRRFLELLRTNEQAVVGHTPRPYSGPALLVRAVASPDDHPDDLGWSALVPSIDVVPVVGDHFTIMSDGIGAVAAAIGAALGGAAPGGLV